MTTKSTAAKRTTVPARLLGATVAAALASAVPAAASAQTMIAASDPDSIAQLFRDEGDSVETQKDSEGDPMLVIESGGVTFSVLFYGCHDHANCDSIQFRSGWEYTDPYPLHKLNQWNVNKRFGKAYRDSKGDPILEMNVNMDGGLPIDNLVDTIAWWKIGLEDFQEHIGW